MPASPQFLSSWVTNTILAYALGLGIIQPLVAHGFTGDHEVFLTIPQLVTHTVSLCIFLFLLVFAQDRAIRMIRPGRKAFDGLIPFLLIVPVSFWLGYYTLYVPFDILFMQLSIGAVNGFVLGKYMNEPKKWLWQSILCSFLGALAGITIGISCYFWFIQDMKGILSDLTIWILIAVPAGTVSALVSKRFLDKQLER